MNKHCVVDAITRNRPYFWVAHSFDNGIMFPNGKKCGNCQIENKKLSDDETTTSLRINWMFSAAKVILRVLFENGKGHENQHHDETEIQFRLTGFSVSFYRTILWTLSLSHTQTSAASVGDWNEKQTTPNCSELGERAYDTSKWIQLSVTRFWYLLRIYRSDVWSSTQSLFRPFIQQQRQQTYTVSRYGAKQPYRETHRTYQMKSRKWISTANSSSQT